MEDDISAATVVASERLEYLNPEYDDPSVKLIANCEYRLFQRPDDAIVPGYDTQTESDLSRPGNFLSNYEPLRPSDARRIIEDAVEFDRFTPPMQKLIKEAAEMDAPDYFCCPAFPRMIGGNPSKNPRYLQDRLDLVDPEATYLAKIGTRLLRRVPLGEPVYYPVNAVLPGRRNNPPGDGVRSLAVFNPIHYLELPELFMEFIASITGKSPSTTGAGSEGALTKGPFNALLPITDLNNALVAYILTGADGFITGGGYIGPKYRFDHDVSLLVPEVWCRMAPEERKSAYLLENRFLEPVSDFEHNGRTVPASRLGYRITARFVNAFFGRIFTNPSVVFTEEMLRPELQDIDIFVDGIDNIVGTGKEVAAQYFEDGGIELASPPLRALLHIMANGSWEGKSCHDAEVRNLFTRDYLLKSDWYQNRLKRQQKHDRALYERHVAYLENYLKANVGRSVCDRLRLNERLKLAKENLDSAKNPEYLEWLRGGIGRGAVMPADLGLEKA